MKRYWIIGDIKTLRCIISTPLDKAPENSIEYDANKIFVLPKFDRFPNPVSVIEGASPEEIDNRIDAPNEVPLWAFRAILNRENLEQNVLLKINDLDEPIKTAALYIWDKGNFVERNSPMLNYLANEIGLTKSQVDQIFIKASELKL